MGRFTVTRVDTDKYNFKTPHLRNVTKSVPYFHDGSTPGLNEAIKRHANLMQGGENEYFDSGFMKLRRRHLRTLSPIFKVLPELTDEEITQVSSFLGALEAPEPHGEANYPKKCSEWTYFLLK